MEDVPSLRDTFLSLGTSVDVQTSCKAHEGHVLGNGIVLVGVIERQSVVGRTGVTYPKVSYCLQAPEIDRKKTRTHGMRTSAHILRHTGPTRGLSGAPMK